MITEARIGLKHGCNSLHKLINEDQIVAQRGKPSLPKLKFMEGPGPERFDEPRVANA